MGEVPHCAGLAGIVVVRLFANGQVRNTGRWQVVIPLGNQGIHPLEHVRVERTSQAPVGGYGNNQYPAYLPGYAIIAHNIGIGRARQVCQNRVQALGVGPHPDNIVLSAPQLGRRHHFHGFGNLLRARHRHNAAADFF